jgi:hypothetical protein
MVAGIRLPLLLVKYTYFPLVSWRSKTGVDLDGVRHERPTPVARLGRRDQASRSSASLSSMLRSLRLEERRRLGFRDGGGFRRSMLAPRGIEAHGRLKGPVGAGAIILLTGSFR